MISKASISLSFSEEKLMRNIRRVVSYEEGEGFAKENGLVFFEVSTKTPYNVTEVRTSFQSEIFSREEPQKRLIETEI